MNGAESSSGRGPPRKASREDVVRAVREFIDENDRGPKMGEMKDELGYGSKEGVRTRLNELEKLGFFTKIDTGKGSPILYRLKYDEDDFVDAINASDQLATVEDVIKEMNFDSDDEPEEIVLTWLRILEADGVLNSIPRGDSRAWSVSDP